MSTRSATHTITNHTVFSSDELAAGLVDLVDPTKPIPADILPTFLHEATHHWCFTSTVGTAIAILALRGRVNALRAIEADDPQDAKVLEQHAADDLTRAEIASLLMRPLAEGLATFAEFVLAGSQRTPVVPPPLRWAAMFTARGQLTGSSDTRVRRRMDLAHRVTISLMEARQSERMRRAKEALLVEPLSCKDSDGYLAGYLTIRALWLYMERHHPRFLEPEPFMLKVYEIFYEDFEFVRLLLDQSQTIPAVLGPITQHFLKRLQYAFGGAKDSLDDFYNSLVSARSRLYADQDAGGRVLPLANSADDNPSVRFRAVWDVVMGTPISVLQDPKSPSQMFETASHMLGHGRDLLRLGQLPVQLSVGAKETIVRVNGQIRARLTTVDGVPAGRTDGIVHILLNTRSGEQVVAAASAQLRLIALQRTSETAKADDIATMRSVMGLIAGAHMAEDTILGQKERLNTLRELTRLDGYLQQARERLDGLYCPFALLYVPDDKLEELVPKMMTNGMYGAFDYDGDLVRAVALIGSTANVNWMPDHLKAEFEKHGLAYEPLMQKLRDCSKSTHLFGLGEAMGIRCTL